MKSTDRAGTRRHDERSPSEPIEIRRSRLVTLTHQMPRGRRRARRHARSRRCGRPAKPRFEFPAVKKLVTSEGGEAMLETVAGTKVTCKAIANNGTIPANGANAVREATVTFTGCEADGFKCKTVGSAVGEVQTNLLKGQLGYLGAVGSGKVGVDLVPEAGELVAEISCRRRLRQSQGARRPDRGNSPAQRRDEGILADIQTGVGQTGMGENLPRKSPSNRGNSEVESVLETSIDSFPFKDAGLQPTKSRPKKT